MFSALDLCRIKAWCAGKGCSLVKRRNTEPAQIQSARASEYNDVWAPTSAPTDCVGQTCCRVTAAAPVRLAVKALVGAEHNVNPCRVNKKTNLAAIVLLLLITAPFQTASTETPSDIQVYRLETEKPFDDVIEDLKFAISEHNFRLTSENNIGRAIAKRENIAFPEATILHFCNLKIAQAFLEIDPDYLLRMPCRIAVRKANNSVIVETWLQPESRQDLCRHIKEVNKILKNIVQAGAE